MLPILCRRRTNVWDDPFEALHHEVDRVFNGYLTPAPTAAEAVGRYPVDIREDDNSIYVDAEVPGFKKDEIDVTLEKGVLSISAERKTEPADGQTHLTERRFTRIQRSFTLPTGVDEGKVAAKLDNGVLHLKLNKRQEVKPRRIEVN